MTNLWLAINGLINVTLNSIIKVQLEVGLFMKNSLKILQGNINIQGCKFKDLNKIVNGQ